MFRSVPIGVAFILAVGLSLHAADPAPRIDALGDPLPAGAVARLGTIRLRHAEEVRAVVYSPDGKILASTGFDHTIRMWDAETGKSLNKLLLSDSRALSLAFTPDSKLLASAGPDQHGVRLWDVGTGKELRRFEESLETIGAVAFTPDGKRLAAAQADGKLRIWERESGQIVHRLATPTRIMPALAFSPDGALLIAGGESVPLTVWHANNGKLRGHLSYEGPSEGTTASLAFSPDGKLIYAGESNDTVHVWEVATSKLVRTIPSSGGVSALAVSPDGRNLATANSHTVRYFDAVSGKHLWEARKHEGEVWSVAFAPDRKRLASAGLDHTIRLWQPATGSEVRAFDARQTARAFDGLDNFGADRLVQSWDYKVSNLTIRSHSQAKSLLSPNGRLQTRAEKLKETPHICLCDVASGKRVRHFKDFLTALAFSPNGRFLAAAKTTTGDDGQNHDVVAVLDVETGLPICTLPHAMYVWGPWVFSPDGQTVACITEALKNRVVLYDLLSGKQRCEVDVAEWAIVDLAFSGNSRLMAISNSKQVDLLEVATGKRVTAVHAHNQEKKLSAVALSPDGRTLAAGSEEGTICLWDLTTMNERHCYRGHQATIEKLAFSANGQNLISASRDTTTLVWDLSVAPPTKPATERLTAAELDTCWTDLAGESAQHGRRAVASLTLHPSQAMILLRQHLRPVTAKDVADVERLIRELDDDSFKARQEATERLERLGRAVLPALQRARTTEGKLSLEARRRVDRLLQALGSEWVPLTGEGLRRQRAMETLEWLNNAEARALLEELSRGVAEADLTVDAKAALARMDRRKAAK